MNNFSAWPRTAWIIEWREESWSLAGTDLMVRRTRVCTCITCTQARKRRRSLKREAAIPPRSLLQLRGLYNTAVTTRSILSITVLGSRYYIKHGVSRFSLENCCCHWEHKMLYEGKQSGLLMFNKTMVVFLHMFTEQLVKGPTKIISHSRALKKTPKKPLWSLCVEFEKQHHRNNYWFTKDLCCSLSVVRKSAWFWPANKLRVFTGLIEKLTKNTLLEKAQC